MQHFTERFTETFLGRSIPGNELKLGDVVQLERINAFCTATVERIEDDGRVTFFRPYVATADFSMGHSVICYTGVEHFTMTPRPGECFRVLQRANLK